MQVKKLILASATAMGLFLTAPASQAGDHTNCVLKNALLYCGADLKQGKKIIDSFASPKTLAILKNAGKTGLIYSNARERESFRRSLEANRGAMKKYADRAWRQYRRRKMSAEDYEEIRTKFKAGMKSYEAGMVLYRAGTWSSTTKGRQAD